MLWLFCALILAVFARAQDGAAYEYEQTMCEGVECNAGACTVIDGRATCVCPDEFIGAFCERPSCSFRGRYVNDACVCLPGYTPSDRCVSCTPVPLGKTTFCVEHGKYFRRIDVDELQTLTLMRVGLIRVGNETRRVVRPETLQLDCACRSQTRLRLSVDAIETVLSDLLDESVSVLSTTDAQLYSLQDTTEQEQGEQRTLFIGGIIIEGLLYTLAGFVVYVLYQWQLVMDENYIKKRLLQKEL